MLAVPSNYLDRHGSTNSAAPPARRIGTVVATLPHDGGGHQYALTLVDALTSICEDDPCLDVAVYREGHAADVSAQLFGGEPVHHTVPATGLVGLASRFAGTGPLGNGLRSAYAFTRRTISPSHVDPDAVRPQPELSAWIDRERLDWVFYTSSTTRAFESERPFVAPIHDLQHRLQPQFEEVSKGGEMEQREYLFRNLARHATLLLVDSEVGREDVLDAYEAHGADPERVRVLPFLPASYLDPSVSEADRAHARAALTLPERYLLYPAQFWPHKNHLRLIEALGLLRRQGEEVHVVLCGSSSGTLREKTHAGVLAAARRLGVERQVHSLGYVPDALMSALYAESAGVVMPTFFGPTNIPVIEGWTFGKPVLTSDIRGIREQVGDAALLVDPASTDAIAEGVRRLWSDTELRARLAARGHARLAEWSPDAFLSTVKSIVADADERVRCGAAPFSVTS